MPNATLAKSTSTVALLTFLSRMLGFVRDIIFATIFGASPAFDAFIIAFKIPNFFRRLFGEGAFSQAFVPVLSDYATKNDLQDTQLFINRIAGTLSVVLLGVVVVGEIIAPGVVLIFAPGFSHDPHRLKMATTMLHYTLPYLMLISLVAFSAAILNTFHRFAIAAFTPVLLNVCLILAAWLLSHHMQVPIYALAIGVLIAGCVQLFFQFPFLRRAKLLPRLHMGFKDPGVRQVLKLMVPALFGVSVAQISLLVDNFFASFLPQGSISWLYYSDRLTYLPLGVIGVALATVVLPKLSRAYSEKNTATFSAVLSWGIRVACLFGLPAAVGLLVLSGPLLATLIHHGAFNVHDVLMTQRSLIAFAIGLPGFMLVKLLASSYYAQKNMKGPVKIAVLALLVNVGLNFLLIHPLAHAGLALSSSVAGMVNASLLILFARDHIKSTHKFLYTRLMLATALMLLILYYAAGTTHTWLMWGELHRIGYLLCLLVVGIGVYFLALWSLGLRRHHFRVPG